ncbi:HD domain-containing protein [Flavobacterium rhizosphaerae]|uniref:HD family phosphohydrolase n=1 Tax=Flavobacterium rhizosphaerae TaxID=3163298 RepID=A0ABW8YUS4_9FLAO
MDFNEAEKFILKKLGSDLPHTLTYHNIDHVKDVLKAVNRHVEASAVNAKDAILLRTAALFHDSGFTVQAAGHEEISCSIAQKYLPGFKYTPKQIERICGMIRATKIPQQPRNKLEEIIADADLDYLGRDDFWEISNRLFTELKTSGIVNTEQEWNKIQVRFFESHKYATGLAQQWRNKKKQKNLEEIKSKIIDSI